MVFFGFLLIVAGAGSLIYGVNQNNSLTAQFQSLYSSGTANPGTIYIIIGAIGAIIGLIMIIAGLLSKSEEEKQNGRRIDLNLKLSTDENINNYRNITSNRNQLINDNVMDNLDEKKCPFCAELIKREAIVCRFCGNNIENNNIKSIPEKQKNIVSYEDFEDPYVVLSNIVLKEFPDINAPVVTDLYTDDIVDFLSDRYEDISINNIWYKIKYEKYEGWCLKTYLKKLD